MDVSGLWKGTAKGAVRNEFVYYTTRGLVEGISQGNWKLPGEATATARTWSGSLGSMRDEAETRPVLEFA